MSYRSTPRGRRSGLLPFVFLTCLVFVIGCGEHDEEAGALDTAKASTGAESPLNILFIVIDAAAAKYVGPYGAELPATPRIDEFAGQATVFERAYAQAPWTLPSVASYLSGRYPPPHQRMIGPGYMSASMAHRVQTAGLQTAGFSESPYITADYSMDIGFATFVEQFPAELLKTHPRDFARRDSEETVNLAAEWLAENGADPFFAYVHLLPPHAPYNPPPPFAGMFATGYDGPLNGDTDTILKIDDGEIEATDELIAHLRAQYVENLAFADHQVGRLLDEVRELGLWQETLIIIASDHGEAFMEHGRMWHNWHVYEEMIHVPLLVHFPPALGKTPARWPGVVSLVDLLPTVLDALEMPADDALPGTSLLHTMRRTDPQDGVALAWTLMTPQDRGVVNHQYKLVFHDDTRQFELYDLVTDPAETTNIASAQLDVVESMAQHLTVQREAFQPARPTGVSPERMRQLRSLGYVGDEEDDGQ